MSLPEIGSTITWDDITTIYVYKVVDYKEIVDQLTNKPELASHLECIDIIERDEFDLEYKIKKIKEIIDDLNLVAKNLSLEDIDVTFDTTPEKTAEEVLNERRELVQSITQLNQTGIISREEARNSLTSSDIFNLTLSNKNFFD